MFNIQILYNYDNRLITSELFNKRRRLPLLHGINFIEIDF